MFKLKVNSTCWYVLFSIVRFYWSLHIKKNYTIFVGNLRSFVYKATYNRYKSTWIYLYRFNNSVCTVIDNKNSINIFLIFWLIITRCWAIRVCIVVHWHCINRMRKMSTLDAGPIFSFWGILTKNLKFWVLTCMKNIKLDSNFNLLMFAGGYSLVWF